MDTMTIAELLEALDGSGLIITDDAEIESALHKLGAASFDPIEIGRA